jgi:hypothetical protein
MILYLISVGKSLHVPVSVKIGTEGRIFKADNKTDSSNKTGSDSEQSF